LSAQAQVLNTPVPVMTEVPAPPPLAPEIPVEVIDSGVGEPEEGADEPVDQVAEQEETCGLSARFPDRIQQWCGMITHYANKRGLEPDLVGALILQESGGNPAAYSKSGAVGLMQVMPSDGIAASFKCPAGPCFANRPTIDRLQDPEFNISYGTRMLSNLFKKKGNMREALKSYGPMDVGYYYADIVLGLQKRYSKD